jgi:protein-tyrosine phosphatase
MIDHLVNEHGVDRKMATEIMDANPLYLESAFNALKRKYGSVDMFLYREMGINEAVKLRLREKFLQ